ncbi:MAG: hypothetical protein P8186_30865, partial [Anaerolineae bacterium]
MLQGQRAVILLGGQPVLLEGRDYNHIVEEDSTASLLSHESQEVPVTPRKAHGALIKARYHYCRTSAHLF